MIRVFAFGITLTCFTGFAAADGAEYDAARALYIEGKYDAALMVLTPMAQDGVAGAQNILALAYENGNGVGQDTELALEWYEKASAQGFARATYNLGVVYEHGSVGLEADLPRAVAYYREAAEADYPSALNNLGYLYETGRGVEQNAETAVEYYQRAYALGEDNARANLAYAYYAGQGIKADLPEARALYREGALLGHGASLNNLGYMYHHGEGGGVDIAAAYGLFVQAYEAGYPRAGSNLSTLMMQEDTYFYDPVRAYAFCLWTVQHIDAAEKDAFQGDCDALKVDLSPDEVKQGVEILASL